MGKLTKARLLAGRAVYEILWAPWWLIALPFALIGVALKWLIENLPDVARPLWALGLKFARICGEAVAGRAALKDQANDQAND